MPAKGKNLKFLHIITSLPKSLLHQTKLKELYFKKTAYQMYLNDPNSPWKVENITATEEKCWLLSIFLILRNISKGFSAGT